MQSSCVRETLSSGTTSGALASSGDHVRSFSLSLSVHRPLPASVIAASLEDTRVDKAEEVMSATGLQKYRSAVLAVGVAALTAVGAYTGASLSTDSVRSSKSFQNS